MGGAGVVVGGVVGVRCAVVVGGVGGGGGRVGVVNVWVVDDVGRNDWVFGVFKYALKNAMCGSLESSVNFFHGYFSFELNSKVGDRTVWYRNSKSGSIELASHCRNNQANSFGSASATWDDVATSGTSPSRIGVNLISNILIVGVCVNGGHYATNNPEIVFQGFNHGS